MSAAAGRRVPNWVLLEPYFFRRDDADSFPDDAEAPIRASGTTSWGANFRIAFSLAEPPKISRLYAQLPGFLGPRKYEPLEMMAAHRHLALLGITTSAPCQDSGQNFFILRVDEKNNPSLTALPPCTEPQYNVPRRPSSKATPRMLHTLSSGLWCGGDKEEDEFVVAELTPCVSARGRIRTVAFFDICFLRSSSTDHQLGRRKWNTKRVQIILPTATDDDPRKLSSWQTDAVIPFQKYLCWVDYHRGILFWDVSLSSTVSFLWFPADKYSLASPLKTPCSGNAGVSVVDHGRALKFAYVARHDSRVAYGPLKPHTGFTITCHTLVLGDDSVPWKEDYTVTSDELPDYLQQGGLPLFPRVDTDKPHIVHFLFVEFEKAYGKMSILSIDMSTKTVESFYLYMDGNDPVQTDDDTDFIAAKCSAPTPRRFLSFEFPRVSYLSRKRKDRE